MTKKQKGLWHWHLIQNFLYRGNSKGHFSKKKLKQKIFIKNNKNFTKMFISATKVCHKTLFTCNFFLPKKVKSFLDFFQAKTNLKKNELTERSTRSFPDWMTSDEKKQKNAATSRTKKINSKTKQKKKIFVETLEMLALPPCLTVSTLL